MHDNILFHNPFDGWYWWHRWINGEAPKVPSYVDKFRAWRPTSQRARDGTKNRHKTGGLKRVS